MIDRRKRLLGGFSSAMVGTLTAALIYLYPEQLHVPAWVAYTACSAFVFAGLTIIASESSLRRTHAWLVVACTVALLVPGAWVAFGPGVRECSVSVPFFSTAGSELLCRGAFGLGAFIVAALLVWVVLRALRQQNAGQPYTSSGQPPASRRLPLISNVGPVRMSGAASAPLGMRVLAWVSWLSLAVAVLTAATALFCQWGVDAESFGARDAGLALYFAFVLAMASVGALYAVPVLVVLGVLSLFLQRRVGFRFLAAGAVTALPLVVLTWFEGA